MTGPTIKVSADAGAVLSELRKVNDAAEKVNQALSAGELEIDAGKAQEAISQLEESAASLTQKLEDAVEAGGDLSGLDLDRAAQELESASKAADGLDKKLTAAGRSGGSMAQTVRHAKDTADHVNRAAKAQAAMAKDGQKLSLAEASAAKRKFDEWRDSGARGTSSIKGKQFDEWASGGWRDFSMDEREAKRHRADVLRSVGLGQDGGGGGSGPSPDEKKAERVGRWSAAAGALGGMAGSMTSGGDGGMWGGAGSAAGSAIGGGAGMIFGGPVGAIVGALGSRLLGGLGASIDAGIERAGQESADYTDLRQALGATQTDFERLRGSVREATDGLGMTYNESAKLARMFAHTSGATAKDAQNIGQEVGTSAGFGRGYGISPEMSVRFFAEMRHMGQTVNDRDNKKLALQIGEAVQRGGTAGKMDEVLSAVSGFVTSATKSSMTEANAGAYASFMSSLTGLHMAGMKGDPATAASAMGAADSAMRQGGGFGEASKNFSLALWQRNLKGFSALDMDFMNEQGAFGSVGRAFGKDSAAYQFAASRGDKGKMRQYDQWSGQMGDRSVMSMQMEALEKQFGDNTDGFRKAIQSHFGVGAGQASALFQAYKSDAGLGGLENKLAGAGVDISKLNTKQVASLAELASGSGADLNKQAAKLKGLTGADALNETERKKLEAAQASGNPEELRKVVLGLTALHDSTRDEGERQRRVQADMNNAIQKLATEMIPLTMDVKEGIAALVEKLAPDSEYKKRRDAEAVSQRQDEDSMRQRVEAYDHNIKLMKSAAASAKTPEERKRLEQSAADLTAQRDAAVVDARNKSTYKSSDQYRDWAGKLEQSDGSSGGTAEETGGKVRPVEGAGAYAGAKPAKAKKELTPQELAFLAETDKLIGAKAGTSAAQIKVESGNDPNAVSPVGARGLAQLMPTTQATLEKRFGHKIESRMDQLKAHRELMAENVRKFGNVPDALRAYNGGWNTGTWGNKETAAYVPKIIATRDADQGGEKMPAGGLVASKKVGQQQVTVAGEMVVVDQNGKRTGQSVPIKQVGAPVAAGSAV